MSTRCRRSSQPLAGHLRIALGRNPLARIIRTVGFLEIGADFGPAVHVSPYGATHYCDAPSPPPSPTEIVGEGVPKLIRVARLRRNVLRQQSHFRGGNSKSGFGPWLHKRRQRQARSLRSRSAVGSRYRCRRLYRADGPFHRIDACARPLYAPPLECTASPHRGRGTRGWTNIAHKFAVTTSSGPDAS